MQISSGVGGLFVLPYSSFASKPSFEVLRKACFGEVLILLLNSIIIFSFHRIIRFSLTLGALQVISTMGGPL